MRTDHLQRRTFRCTSWHPHRTCTPSARACRTELRNCSCQSLLWHLCSNFYKLCPVDQFFERSACVNCKKLVTVSLGTVWELTRQSRRSEGNTRLRTCAPRLFRRTEGISHRFRLAEEECTPRRFHWMWTLRQAAWPNQGLIQNKSSWTYMTPIFAKTGVRTAPSLLVSASIMVWWKSPSAAGITIWTQRLKSFRVP